MDEEKDREDVERLEVVEAVWEVIWETSTPRHAAVATAARRDNPVGGERLNAVEIISGESAEGVSMMENLSKLQAAGSSSSSSYIPLSSPGSLETNKN